MKKIISFLKEADKLRSEIEVYLVNFASGIIPWFAALIPAYFAFVHVHDILGVPWGFSFVFAAVIEVLGFASISTFVEFRNLRERYKDGATKGSVSPVVPALSFGMYLLVIVLVNGVLSFVERVEISVLYSAIVSGDTQSIVVYLFEPMAISFSIFVLSFMTIPGAVIVASRTTQEQFLQQKGLLGRDRPKGPSKSNTEATKSKPVTKTKEKKLSSRKRKFLTYVQQNPRAMQDVTKTAGELNISRGSVYNYDKELQELGYYEMLPDNLAVKFKE